MRPMPRPASATPSTSAYKSQPHQSVCKSSYIHDIEIPSKCQPNRSIYTLLPFPWTLEQRETAEIEGSVAGYQGRIAEIEGSATAS